MDEKQRRYIIFVYIDDEYVGEGTASPNDGFSEELIDMLKEHIAVSMGIKKSRIDIIESVELIDA